MKFRMVLVAALTILAGCGGTITLLSQYSDEFDGALLDMTRWTERLDGYKDANPPVPVTYTISYSLAGGELALAPEPATTADWWNGWYGPGLFTGPLDWSTGGYRVDVSVKFTPSSSAASHFAGLIIRDAANPYHYIKFASFGSLPGLFDMNICRDKNGWPASGYSHYLNPTTDINISAGAPPPGYDSITQAQDAVADFPDFTSNIFAVWVQHSRSQDEAVLRVVKSGSRVTLYYSTDGGATFTKGMSGIFNPAQVRIGLVANEMGKPFGGDSRAHFKYIRVYRTN
ncbi:MAG: hypothetical protein MUD12_16525 [Spirochaetes bacterium]|jgi:hypothetical protein|nr:hypothetical protein [Spirochaetota bacterium]